MRKFMVAALASAGVFAVAVSAAAQTPVAVVEEVSGKAAGVEFMDYVTPGTKIELGSKGSVVLSYMKSCQREVIKGGTVTVGTERSAVANGKVERTVVGCDASHIRLAAGEANQSAATVFRSLLPGQQREAKPQITLYGRSPVVETNGPGTLVVERLDQSSEPYDIVVSAKSLDRGRFFDFAKAHKALTPGATYRASFGKLSIVFTIDDRAKSGATPIIGRLLRFAEAH
jgi:hypothetical protein